MIHMNYNVTLMCPRYVLWESAQYGVPVPSNHFTRFISHMHCDIASGGSQPLPIPYAVMDDILKRVMVGYTTNGMSFFGHRDGNTSGVIPSMNGWPDYGVNAVLSWSWSWLWL